MKSRRPRKPGRKRDAYDRLNAPLPDEQKNHDLDGKFNGIPWVVAPSKNYGVKEDGRER